VEHTDADEILSDAAIATPYSVLVIDHTHDDDFFIKTKLGLSIYTTMLCLQGA